MRAISMQSIYYTEFHQHMYVKIHKYCILTVITTVRPKSGMSSQMLQYLIITTLIVLKLITNKYCNNSDK